MDRHTFRFLLIAPGPRPPFRAVAERLWGRDCDFDSDGNSSTADARDWTELSIALRPECVERVDVEPVSGYPRLVLRIMSDRKELARRAAKFLATYTGGRLREELRTPADRRAPNTPGVHVGATPPEGRGATRSIPTKIVLRDEKTASDSRHLSAQIEDSGDLVFTGQDIGPAVADFFGVREYEWTWTVKAGDVAKLKAALGVSGDVLGALHDRFGSGHASEIEPFLKQHAIPYQSWTRMGD